MASFKLKSPKEEDERQSEERDERKFFNLNRQKSRSKETIQAGNMAGEDEVVVEQPADKEAEQEDGEGGAAKCKSGNKARDLWESESVHEKTARRAKYSVVANLQDEKEKALREQAKSLFIPLQEAEEMIQYLKGQPEPKEKKAKANLSRGWRE